MSERLIYFWEVLSGVQSHARLYTAYWYSFFLSLFGVKYAILLGALSALLNLIPYFGLMVSMILACLVALFSGNPGVQVPLVILFYLAQNLMETSFLVPKIVGGKIGLHPAVLILSLLVFSYFFGFVGLIIALPVTSIILMFVNEWLDKRQTGSQRSH